jgi:hypothetical protein
MPITTPSGSNDLGPQQPADQDKQPTIRHARGEPGHQPLMVDAIKELLQIDVDHPLMSVLQVLAGLGNCRVATAAGSNPRLDGWNIGSNSGSSTRLTGSITTLSATFGMPSPRCPPPA